MILFSFLLLAESTIYINIAQDTSLFIQKLSQADGQTDLAKNV